jgi:hypothetical protein
MIQSICSVCGNKKTFEDIHLGRLFKCPKCKSPVKVEQANFEDVSLKSTLNDTIEDSNIVVNSINTEDVADRNNVSDLKKEELSEKGLEKIVADQDYQKKKLDNKKEEIKENSITKQVLIISVIVVAFIIFWKIYTSNAQYNLDSIPAADTVSYNQVDTAAVIDTSTPEYKLGEVYSTILSVIEIQQNQIDNLSLSDLLDYKNEMLARHNYTFEDPVLLENYQKQQWYKPYNNYLVATAGFSEVEKYNFTLLDNKLQTIYTNLTIKIKDFYSSIVDKSFDANNYFSDNVETFITKSNLNPLSINEEMTNHYSEFTESSYEFPDPLEITLVKSENGIDYFKFKFFYSAFRASKNKKQACDVTVQWGLDRDQKITSYKEIKIENLKFSDPVIEDEISQ